MDYFIAEFTCDTDDESKTDRSQRKCIFRYVACDWFGSTIHKLRCQTSWVRTRNQQYHWSIKLYGRFDEKYGKRKIKSNGYWLRKKLPNTAHRSCMNGESASLNYWITIRISGRITIKPMNLYGRVSHTLHESGKCFIISQFCDFSCVRGDLLNCTSAVIVFWWTIPNMHLQFCIHNNQSISFLISIGRCLSTAKAFSNKMMWIHTKWQ